MTERYISTVTLISRGWLWVNIPALIIILAVLYTTIVYLIIDNKLPVLIAVVAGWIYWRFGVQKWVRWALANNVNPEKLLKVGQLALLLWSSLIIDKVIKQKASC